MDRRRFLTALAASTLATPAWAADDAVRALGAARIDRRLGDGPLTPSRTNVLAWADACCDAVAAWYGRFPVPTLRLDLEPVPGRGVFGGKAWGGSAPRVRVRIGSSTPLPALYADWVLVHELVHLALPNVPSAHHWLEEGLATYVEPWIRVEAGQITREKAWLDLVEGLPKGQPAAGDRGLDRTPTWGRTYWGGALYCLLVDLELRREQPAVGLKQGLVGLLDAGGAMTESWSMDRVVDTADAAVGRTAFRAVWAAHRESAVAVDLPALWRALGVVESGSTVRFEDSAPLAAVRRAIDGTDRASHPAPDRTP